LAAVRGSPRFSSGSSDVQPLTGLTVVEVSSFVAAPLCGVTLNQLGAQVIRVDPIGGASDVKRWPLTADGTSIYWTGLNKGKRSATIDVRSAEGQELVARLVVEGDGIVVTNAVLPWPSHDVLAAKRSDVIHVQLLGRGDGSTGVDYTVNAAIGYPLVDRSGQPRRSDQPRAAGLGCVLRPVCGAGRCLGGAPA
jgi:2-methylfumaryl-CoA isomerase